MGSDPVRKDKLREKKEAIKKQQKSEFSASPYDSAGDRLVWPFLLSAAVWNFLCIQGLHTHARQITFVQSVREKSVGRASEFFLSVPESPEP